MATKTRSVGGARKSGRSKASRRTHATGSRKAKGGDGLADLEVGFVDEVADMLHAERQLIAMLPKMAGQVDLPRLRNALEWHLRETQEHAHRLEKVFDMLGEKIKVETCEGMKGILDEGKEMVKKANKGPFRDAVIIAAAQKVEHYEIASYGTLCAWAEQLGKRDIARLLEQTLNEEKAADRNLTRIAESETNPEADEPEPRRGRSVMNEDDEDLSWGRSEERGRGSSHVSRGERSHRGREERELEGRR